ncbi:MAG: T9SS type A sorting domain-containing protein [bacterium]|nr:T9SS type A sorting domain-containing protein [bacterium]
MLAYFLLLACAVSLAAQESLTLTHDSGAPVYIFRHPDAFGNDWRNQRFTAPIDGQLIGAYFCFGGRSDEFTTGTPKPVWQVWSGDTSGLPVTSLGTLEHPTTIPIAYHHLDSTWVDSLAPWTYTDLSSMSLAFSTGDEFHIGYSLVNPEPGDSLAILADRGNPETDYASEWSGGAFHFLFESWRGVNLFLRAEYLPASASATPHLLLPDRIALRAYPNPFNTSTRIEWSAITAPANASLHDLLGRRVQTWSLAPNTNHLTFDARGIAAGRYYLSLTTTSSSASIPLLYLK